MDARAKFRQAREKLDYQFHRPPIVIGGLAMEYYGLREAGDDIDLVVCNRDYERLAQFHPAERKDIWGDLGIILPPFEIWRSICLLDYEYYGGGSAVEAGWNVVSLAKLMQTRVFAQKVPKYADDLELISQALQKKHANKEYQQFAESNGVQYRQNNGIVLSGDYRRGEE
jgi:hypothetical protein